MTKTFLAVLLIVAVVCLAGGFIGGMQYEKSRSPLANLPRDSRQMFQGRIGAGEPGGMGRGAGSNFVSGEVISKDDQSVTVKTADGGSKIVFFSDSTQISKTTDGSISDVEVGKTVMVSGKANQDGSITAQSIQIRPLPSLPANAQ